LPIDFKIDFPEGEWKNLISKIKGAAKLSIKYTAIDVWGNIRRNSPVNHGRLAGSFALSQLEEFAWKIHSSVKYALAVHEGTGLYGPEKRKFEIRPVKKKALYWKGAPHPVKKVMHPGQKPNPFVEKSIDQTTGRLDEFVRRAISETVD